MQIPTDKWDEELEEGDTILAIDFTQAILIRAHHANDLAAKANEGKEAKTFEEMVPEWCRDFADLFEKKNFDKLPEPRTWDHAIELTPNANANLDCKVYPLNHSEQAELDKFLDENLSSGRIRPSKSPMASPFFFVKKKDDKLRPVQDYCKLNEMTIKNCYPLPLISELWINYGARNTSPSLTSGGDTTMFVSKVAMSGKQHSELIKGCSNPRLCSLGSPTRQQPSNG